MSQSSFTYPLPEEIQSDLVGMLVTDRNELQEMWSMISDVPTTTVTDNGKTRVRSAVLADVHSSKTTSPPPLRLAKPMARMYSMRMKFVSIAAALVVGLSISLSPDSQQFRAGSGVAPTLVSLADGSTVSLSAGSRISVPESFGQTSRNVIVHGQAFFDVVPGSVPFVVKTFDSETEVLGTSFSVKAWPGTPEASTEVVVKSGRVSVQSSITQALVTPGEAVSVSHLSSEPTLVDVTSSLYWVDGGFFFDNELVENVISEIERRFDVDIKAPSSIKLRRFNYSKDRAEGAEEVMGDLAVTIGVRYRPTANGFELYLDN